MLLDWIDRNPTLGTIGKIEYGLNVRYYGIIAHFLRCDNNLMVLHFGDAC